MGQTNFPDGVTVGNADGTATFNLGATTVYATAAELNALNAAGLSATELGYLNTTSPGTAVASKALVFGAAKDIDTIDFASAGGVKIAGVALTASMAELNMSAGALGAKVLSYDSATPQVVASGSTAITTAGTIATGLAGGAVGQVIASIANAGTIAASGAPAVVYARATGSAGSVIFELYGLNGAVATNVGTVNWVAFGTAA